MKLLSFFCFILFATTALFGETNVLLFAGSTRADSLNRKLVRAAAMTAQELGAKVDVIDLKNYPIPFYDADEEALYGMPANARAIRRKMVESQVIVIASPNYNRSVSAILKNVLDWTSRGEDATYSKAAFQGKNIIIMSAGPGASGGVKGLDPLRSILGACGSEVPPQQFVLPNANSAFTVEGKLRDPQKAKELRAIIQKALVTKKSR